jgi:hypothetical protein
VTWHDLIYAVPALWLLAFAARKPATKRAHRPAYLVPRPGSVPLVTEAVEQPADPATIQSYGYVAPGFWWTSSGD